MHIMIQIYYRYENEEGNSVMSHITIIESMARQLADYGIPVDDQQLLPKSSRRFLRVFTIFNLPEIFNL